MYFYTKYRTLNTIGDSLTEVSKKSIGNLPKIAFAVTMIACSLQSIDEFIEYSSAFEVVNEYKGVLNELRHCGDENIEYAAETIYQDMQGVFRKYLAGGANFIGNLASYASTTTLSVVLGLSKEGLVIDLAALAAGIVLGNSLNADITNYVTVECSNGVVMAANNALREGVYIVNAEGSVGIIESGENTSIETRDIIDFCIYSRIWAEKKYIGYLHRTGLILNDDQFIYNDENSEEKAQENIVRLVNLRTKYQM